MDTSIKSVDLVLKKEKRWLAEMERLRSIIQEFDLTEEVKWAKPTYSYNGSNVVMIMGFKEYAALMFFKGALLKDEKGLLIRAGENTQAARQMRFTSVEEIDRLERSLKAYLHEAIEVEKAGLNVELKTTDQYDVPEEFQSRLDSEPDLKRAFEALTPGRQRGYLLHFGGAKQSTTRASRVEKCVPLILEGKGLNDDYGK